MKRRKLFAGIAAMTLTASMAVPMSAGAVTAYDTTTGSAGTGSAVFADSASAHDAWLTQTITDKDSNEIKSYNATEFKKVLEIEDTANIPSVSFDYAVTVPGSNIPATYNADKTVKTLAVFAGIDPTLITYKYENITDEATAFTTTTSAAYTTTPTAADGKSFKVTYAPQNVSLPDEGSTKKADHDDNVLLYNAAASEGKSGVNTYYAIKTVQMDFSAVKFTEPGIYRYYIEETGSNQGVTNDYENLDDDGNEVANTTRWRTLDVYVEDATYTDASDDVHNKLKIAGYVMYVGKQTAAPAAGAATNDSPTADKMEDGVNHTNPSGNGGKNGVEVEDATKSEGIRNLYETSDITFKKTVSGNQSSKDKFFKFNIKLTPDGSSNVANNDVFVISTQVVDEAYKDGTDAPNAATPYSKGAIYTANHAAVDATTSKRYVTGEQLKADAGYDFYLQADQTVTIQGIPNGVGYVLTEYQDDYTPTVTMKSDTGYDNLAGGTAADGGTAITAPTIGIAADKGNIAGALEAPQNTASITDAKILGDVEATFNNDRSGTIPTGVLLSVAAPAGLAVLFLGGLGVLHVQRKRRKSESK